MIEWRKIVYRDADIPFEVSRDGEVRRIAGPNAAGRHMPSKIAKPHMISGGYMQVVIKHNKITYSPLVHTLVALAFLGPPPGRYGRGADIIVNHINGIKTDNRAENLEWVTYQQNSDHASAMGLMRVGESNHAAVLTEKDVLRIRQLFAAGRTRASLRRQFGCSYCAIDLICRRVTWRHI